MPVEYTKIASSKDPENSFPWFELEVEENLPNRLVIRIINDNDAEGPNIEGMKANLGDYDLDTRWVIAHTMSGLEVYNRSKKDEIPDDLLSNLAYWHPETDTLEILDFVES